MLKVSVVDQITRAQQGDSQAIAGLYEQYYLPIYRYLYYRVDSTQTAEDLTGDVFTRLLTTLPGLHRQQISLPAWLYRVARNLVIDYYRKVRLRRFLSLDESLPAQNPEPVLLAENRLTGELLHQALSQISEDQREVIILRFVAGLSIREVAGVVKKSEDAVKGLQRRGLISLRQMLKEEEVQDAQHG